MHVACLNNVKGYLSSLEGILLCYGKYAEETFSTPEVIIPNGSIIFLPSSIKNIYLDLNIIFEGFEN